MVLLAQAPKLELCSGNVVRLRGLQGASHLNGMPRS